MSVYVCALCVRVNGGAFLIDFVPILISDNAKLDAWCEQWSWNMYGAHFGVITTDTNVYGVLIWCGHVHSQNLSNWWKYIEINVF